MQINLFTFLLLFFFSSIQSKLYQAFLFFRHGARYHTNAIYDGNSTFPVWGELTSIGMRQQQNLGKLIRSEYIEKLGLINDKYNLSEVEIYSTNYHRTMQSGISFMEGLYPSGNAGPRIPYVDRPYHLPPYATNKTDIEQQNYALPNGHLIKSVKLDNKVILKDCNNWEQLVAQAVTKRQSQYEQMNMTYYPFLKKLTGIFFKNQTGVIKLENAIQIFDTLYIDKYLGRTAFPANFTQDDYKNLEHLSNWYYSFIQEGQIAHLINTYKFRKVIDTFENRIRLLNTYALKMSIMAVHDTDIAALFADLNITTAQCQEELYRKGKTDALNCQTSLGFATNLIIEFHSDDGTGFYIKVRQNGKYMNLCQKQSIKCDYAQWKIRVKATWLNNVEDICKH